MIEIVIPSLRQTETERLVRSLAMGAMKPDLVSVVSNEVVAWSDPGVPTRLLRFSSESYAIGEQDVALRQNIGIWEAQGDVIVIQGDDQVAPSSMVADSVLVLGTKQYIWGNHRLTDFSSIDPLSLVDAPMKSAQSRELPPNHEHSYFSCYGGMLVARSAFLREAGGFDMAFNGRHGGEDQALGYRLMTALGDETVFIHEPPFSWHPVELATGNGRDRAPWLTPQRNGCAPGAHLIIDDSIDGVAYQRCDRCRYWHFPNYDGLFRADPLIPYDHSCVTVESVWIE